MNPKGGHGAKMPYFKQTCGNSRPGNGRFHLQTERPYHHDHTGDTFAPEGKLRYSHPLNIDEVAVDNPELKIVICHIGNPWIRDCMEIVYKNKNVYADISGLVLGDFKSKFKKFMLKQIQEMIVYAGEPNYLLYGTDWPICRMKSYLKFVDKLDLAPENKEKILWKNTAALFKLNLAKPAAATA